VLKGRLAIALAASQDDAWRQAETARHTYFPPTFAQDQMTHAAADIGE
tara:strand:+ start:1303 stop:1446 length:144 start_codon:yes stop_codon:yes gene_type:complete